MCIRDRVSTSPSDNPSSIILLRMEDVMFLLYSETILSITPSASTSSGKRYVSGKRYPSKELLLISHFFSNFLFFEAFIKQDLPKIKLIAHCQKGNKIPLYQVSNIDNEVLIMIGPEGDFSQLEIENAQNQFFTEITLGSQRLRTETAGLLACSKVATLREII